MKIILKVMRDDGTVLLNLVGGPFVRWDAPAGCELIEANQDPIRSIEVVFNDAPMPVIRY